MTVHVAAQAAAEASRAQEVQPPAVNQPLTQQAHLVALLSRQQAAAEEERETAVSTGSCDLVQEVRPIGQHHIM